MQCTTYDARNERCVGPFNHPGSHHCEDGVWGLPKLETPNATAALAVLNKNRRTGVPAPLPIHASKEPPSPGLPENMQIRRAIGAALQGKHPNPHQRTALDAVNALLEYCASLDKQIRELGMVSQMETYTASFLCKCLHLPVGTVLSVRSTTGSLFPLDDDEQVLQAVTPPRRKW